MTTVGFEPTHPEIAGLKSAALDHSAKLPVLIRAPKATDLIFSPFLRYEPLPILVFIALFKRCDIEPATTRIRVAWSARAWPALDGSW